MLKEWYLQYNIATMYFGIYIFEEIKDASSFNNKIYHLFEQKASAKI